MNKKEAIRELMSKSREIIFGDDENVYLSRKRTIELVSQIDEPQKVVVPKFVAEWIEKHKNNNGKKDRLSHALEHVFDEVEVGLYIKQQEGDYTETIAKAWIDGYTIEQEKLYTVEIEGVSSSKLFKNIQTNNYLFHSGKGLKGYTDRLTETEIKQKDERLCQFAKEVK